MRIRKVPIAIDRAKLIAIKVVETIKEGRSIYSRKSHASRARTRLGQWHAAFLRALAKTPSVTVAAKAASVKIFRTTKMDDV